MARLLRAAKVFIEMWRQNMLIPEEYRGVFAVSIKADGRTIEVHRGDGRGDELLSDAELYELVNAIRSRLVEDGAEAREPA